MLSDLNLKLIRAWNLVIIALSGKLDVYFVLLVLVRISCF